MIIFFLNLLINSFLCSSANKKNKDFLWTVSDHHISNRNQMRNIVLFLQYFFIKVSFQIFDEELNFDLEIS